MRFFLLCHFLYTVMRAELTFCLIGAVSDSAWRERMTPLKWTARIFAVLLVGGTEIYNNITPGGLSSWLAALVHMSVISVVCHIQYGCRKRDAFTVAFWTWGLLAMVDFFMVLACHSVLSKFWGKANPLLLPGKIRGIYLLIGTVLTSCLGRGIVVWVKKRQNEVQEALRWFCSLLPVVGICIFFFTWMFQRNQTCPYRQPGFRVFYFARVYQEELIRHGRMFLLGFAATLFLLILGGIRREVNKRFFQLQNRMKQAAAHYQSLLRAKNEKEFLLHDIRKYHRVLAALIQEGKQKEALACLGDMDQVLQKSGGIDYVNHGMLNFILNQKFQEAEEAGIRVEKDCDDMEGLRLSPLDISALFDNILDNAIEANQRLEEEQERWLKFICIRDNRLLRLSVSNPNPEKKLRSAGGRWITTKENKEYHGLGIRIIEKTLRTYDGHMNITADDKTFQFTAYLIGFDGEE